MVGQARGERLLFIDADVRLEAGAAAQPELRRLLAGLAQVL